MYTQVGPHFSDELQRHNLPPMMVGPWAIHGAIEVILFLLLYINSSTKNSILAPYLF